METTVEVIQVLIEFLVEWKWPILLFWLIRPFRREIVGTLSRGVDTLTRRVSRFKAADAEVEFAPAGDALGALIRKVLVP